MKSRKQQLEHNLSKADGSWKRGQSAGYNREVDLPRLLPVWPHEIEDTSEDGIRSIIVRLGSALRAERNRGIAGHWSYDLDRHLGLLRALRAECKFLDSLIHKQKK